MKLQTTIAALAALMLATSLTAQDPRPQRGNRIDQMFQRMDKNKDGAITKEEMKAGRRGGRGGRGGGGGGGGGDKPKRGGGGI